MSVSAKEPAKATITTPSDREVRIERISTATFEDLGDGRTRVVTTSLFHTTEERDGMLQSGMEQGLNRSYAALDRLLATLD